MSALTIKNLPEPLLDHLRDAAAESHRSLNKEVIARLSASFKRSEEEWGADRVAEQADAWEHLEGSWESDISAEEEIAALYAARSAGREVPPL